MTEPENPFARRPAPPSWRHFAALARRGRGISGVPSFAPRWMPPFKPYAYRGIGADTLTAFMDDEPDSGERLTRRQERIETIAPLLRHLTAREAAEMLGVSMRTIERYKRELTAAETRPS